MCQNTIFKAKCTRRAGLAGLEMPLITRDCALLCVVRGSEWPRRDYRGDPLVRAAAGSCEHDLGDSLPDRRQVRNEGAAFMAGSSPEIRIPELMERSSGPALCACSCPRCRAWCAELGRLVAPGELPDLLWS